MNIHIITDLLRLGGISVDYPAQCPSSSRDTQSRVSRPMHMQHLEISKEKTPQLLCSLCQFVPIASFPGTKYR